MASKKTTKIKSRSDHLTRTIQYTNGNTVATLDKKKGRYVHKVELISDRPFSLVPVLMTEGEYAGQHVLVFQPERTIEETFPFLKLPPEIRNMIYSFALERPGYDMRIDAKMDGTIEPRWHINSGSRGYSPWSSYSCCLGLLSVNRQIHAESAPFLYSRHCFEVGTTRALQDFLPAIGPENVKLLTHVRVLRHYKNCWKDAYGLLSPAISLHSLEIGKYDNFAYHNRGIMSLPDVPKILLPLIRAMCDEGRDRESALAVIKVTGGLKVECTHGQWCLFEGGCELTDNAYKTGTEEVKAKIGKLMDEAKDKEKKKKALKTGSSTKTRAGRKVKAVDYEEYDSDEDYEE